MTQEEKEVLLQDLCMRLPYGVMLYCKPNGSYFTRMKLTSINLGCSAINGIYEVENVRPYLRPLASMTDDERTLFRMKGGVMGYNPEHDTWGISALAPEAFYWMLANMFDINDLIPMGLAVDVTNKKDVRNFNYDGYKKR